MTAKKIQPMDPTVAPSGAKSAQDKATSGKNATAQPNRRTTGRKTNSKISPSVL